MPHRKCKVESKQSIERQTELNATRRCIVLLNKLSPDYIKQASLGTLNKAKVKKAKRSKTAVLNEISRRIPSNENPDEISEANGTKIGKL